MFESVTLAPPDPILGLTEAFAQDANPQKINLSVGVYRDASGNTPVLAVVKAAEQRLLKDETSKAYRPISGAAAFATATAALAFGEGHPLLAAGRVVTCHSPGGTGGLRVVGDYLHNLHPTATLWLTAPTWSNHPAVFAAAGVPTRTYPYFNAETNSLDFDAMFAALGHVPAGDVVLLHGCCHNPTGVDPTVEQWRQIGKLLAERGVVPLVDFAYQGFAVGVREDAAGLLALLESVPEAFVCASFSKNFGLYNERTGAMSVVAADADAAGRVFSQVKLCIRTNYSNPPAHGGAIVTTVLTDPALRQQWEGEVAAMRERINGMRRLFVEALNRRGIKLSPGGNDFIARQNGMFSFSGLSKDQVQALRDRYSIYIVGSGRINVAGITQANLDRLCDAIADVV